MSFVQLIDCKTTKFDDMNRLMDTWVEQTKGKRTATHNIIGKDRSDASHYIEIVEFPSYEEAMKNSNLPETDRIFQEMVALCDEMPTFTDLDVVRDEQLNKATARRFYEEVVNQRRLDVIDEIFASDYRDHDPANEQDYRGIAGVKEETSMYVDAFGPRFTIQNQLAEGDFVTTVWTCVATHTGEFRGIRPTNKQVTMTGQTTHRFSHDGKIAEGWWNWDHMSLLREVGAVEVKR
jgi:predicted ester cyclase